MKDSKVALGFVLVALVFLSAIGSSLLFTAPYRAYAQAEDDAPVNQELAAIILNQLVNEVEGNLSKIQELNVTLNTNSSVIIPVPVNVTNGNTITTENDTDAGPFYPMETLVKIVKATGKSQMGNPAKNVIDDNLETRYSANFKKNNIVTLKLNDTWDITAFGIAFYKGDKRTATIDISVEGQGGEFFISNGRTNQVQNFTLSDPFRTKEVKITGYGNSINDWNSMTEVRLYGFLNGTGQPGPVEPPTCPIGQIYNSTSKQCETPTLPPPPTCEANEHLEGNQCVPNPVECGDNEIFDSTLNKCVCKDGYGLDSNGKCIAIQPPEPEPTTNITKIDAVGDIDCSTTFRDAVAKDDPDLLVHLGDLCYKSTLSTYKSVYKDFKNDDKLQCVPGNHDVKEDGSSSLEVETLAYCKDHWSKLVANGTTLLLGINTNGNPTTQINAAASVLRNDEIMKDVVNVVEFSHKPMSTHPNSHHNVESTTKTIYQGIEAEIPDNVDIYRIAGHNHVKAESSNGKYFISGSGGRSNYECGTSQDWPYCDNKIEGYLQLLIDNTGNIQSQFVDLKGNIIH